MPADILLLNGSTENAFVDTSSINGELSLREKKVANRELDFLNQSLQLLEGKIDCLNSKDSTFDYWEGTFYAKFKG